jgi:hypothetical protein
MTIKTIAMTIKTIVMTIKTIVMTIKTIVMTITSFKYIVLLDINKCIRSVNMLMAALSGNSHA